MSQFHGRQKSDILFALSEAAVNLEFTLQRFYEEASKKPNPFLENPQAYLEELAARIKRAQEGQSSYRSALEHRNLPYDGLGLVTFVRIAHHLAPGFERDPERGGNLVTPVEELIIGPLFDEREFESALPADWRFLFALGRVRSPYPLSELKSGFKKKIYHTDNKVKYFVATETIREVSGYGKPPEQSG